MKEKAYLLTSPKFEGSILFKYGLNGLLTEIKISAQMEPAHQAWLLQHLPYHIRHIAAFKKQSPSIEFEEMPVDLSFEHFWKTYGNFAGKKKHCRTLWNNLSDAERSKCLNFLPIYKSAKVRDGTALAYPETYINQRNWE